MEQVVPEKWHCIECHRNVICKADTLAVLGWRFSRLGQNALNAKKKKRQIDGNILRIHLILGLPYLALIRINWR